MQEIIENGLIAKIMSQDNIYKAIYCLNSCIKEKGLLDNESLKSLYDLGDKFNFNLIGEDESEKEGQSNKEDQSNKEGQSNEEGQSNKEEILVKCQERLKEILTNPDDLFEISVYFMLKKFEKEGDNEGEIKYRPIHTASLIDQICMISMLLPLMYDDTSGERKMSILSKLIPHDFYGNLPTDDVGLLYKNWQDQYKAYSQDIIDASKQYKETRQFRTEISLDIKNFFPSIPPTFLLKYISDKLRWVYPDKQSRSELKTVLSKLLFYKIKRNNLKEWEKEYYGDIEIADADEYYAQGVPQGLPQAYFFSNICMLEVKQAISKIEEFHGCESFFYVDDSVIYITAEFDKNREEDNKRFQNLIKELNDSVEASLEKSKPSEGWDSLQGFIPKKCIEFQKKLKYGVKFHDHGKSDFCKIEEAGMSIAGLGSLRRETSAANSIFFNTTEIEDLYSEQKLRIIAELIDDEIKRVKKIIEEKDENETGAPEARLKHLKRYKRFYLYRLKLVNRRLCENYDELLEDFYRTFKINDYKESEAKPNGRDEFLEQWFESYDEDIFLPEASRLLQELPIDKADKLEKELKNFEQRITESKDSDRKEYLYFTKVFTSIYKNRGAQIYPYKSLIESLRKLTALNTSLSPIKQKKHLEKFVTLLLKYREQCKIRLTNSEGSTKDNSESSHADDNNKNLNYLSELIKNYALFIFVNSEEFVRMILNAYYSLEIGVDVNDSLSFTKSSSRQISYTELRILAQLRNKYFNAQKFAHLLDDIRERNLENRMCIDMGLMEVLHLFIRYVGQPEYVDHIICTHRVVKGLWYNGSKFMNEYTLHNEEHAVTLIKNVVKLTKAIDYLAIKQVDYYILFLACYLHDISMVIHPNIKSFAKCDEKSLSIINNFIYEASKLFSGKKEADVDKQLKEIGIFIIHQFENVFKYFADQIRERHPKDSAKNIKDWKNSILDYLPDTIISHVAGISESHGYDSDEVYGRKSLAKEELLSEKYCMMLIRLADLMDVSNDRINYYLLRQNVSHMDPVSQFHWISHLITDEIHLYPTYSTDEPNDETGRPKEIENRRINEYLNFNLYLNVKFLESSDKLCKECHLTPSFDTEIVKLPDEYSDYEGLSIIIRRTDTDEVKKGRDDTDEVEKDGRDNCPLICKWIHHKHYWFFKELEALSRYLFSVNDRWFKSEIRFNIIYRDDKQLDADFVDSVRDHIN